MGDGEVRTPTRRAGRGARALAAAALLGLLVVGTLARTLPAADAVLGESPARLLGVDAYFHLRHARSVVEHFPSLQRWDVGTDYPVGQRSAATGLFDLALGAAAWLSVGGDAESPALAERLALVVAWAPVVCGVGALLVLYFIGAGLGGRRSSGRGLAAVLVASLYPGSFIGRTTLGFGDQHAAEVLLALLAAWGALSVLSAERWRPRQLLAAAPLVLLAFTWIGAPLLLGVFAVAAAAVCVAAPGGLTDPRPAPVGAWAGSALLGLGAVALAAPSLVMDGRLLLLSAALLAAVAAGCPALLSYARRRRAHLGRGRVALESAAAILVAAALVVAASPSVRAALAEALAPKTDLVAEHREIGPSALLGTFGVALLLALGGVALALRRALRGAEGWQRMLFAAVLLLELLAFWVRTNDYGYLVGPFVALLAACALDGAAARRRARTAGAAVAVAAALLLAPIWPLGLQGPPWLLASEVARSTNADRGWLEAMDWMREQTPAPTLAVTAQVAPFGDDFAYPEGTYGVAANWDYGHLVAALGERHAVASQGLSRQTTTWFTSRAPEDETVAVWESRCRGPERVRYVVADAYTMGSHYDGLLRMTGLRPEQAAERLETPEGSPLPVFGARYRDAIGPRLFRERGQGLARYRLVFETTHRSALYYELIYDEPGARGQVSGRVELRTEPEERFFAMPAARALLETGHLRGEAGHVYAPELLPTVRVFEIVAGAAIEGAAPPGTAPGAGVEVRLALRSQATGEAWTYVRRGVVGPDGRYRVRVAYPTVRGGVIAAEGDYSVLVGGTVVGEVAVSEQAVNAGSVVPPTIPASP